jgi:hypothetical protein
MAMTQSNELAALATVAEDKTSSRRRAPSHTHTHHVARGTQPVQRREERGNHHLATDVCVPGLLGSFYARCCADVDAHVIRK